MIIRRLKGKITKERCLLYQFCMIMNYLIHLQLTRELLNVKEFSQCQQKHGK